MSGFRYCSFCWGYGCVACDGELAKFTRDAHARAPKFRDPDVRDIRDHALDMELVRGMNVLEGMWSAEQIEEIFKPLLDAEYARQFPGGPKPMFTARTDDAGDMALMKTIVGAAALDEIFAGGVTKEALADMDGRAEKARLVQAARQVFTPEPERTAK